MRESDGSRILLVIPAFQESARLGPWLDQLLPEMAELDFVDVLVVDDGSGDQESGAMLEQVEARQGDYPFLCPLLVLSENQGKGGAIKAGWKTSENIHGWVAFADADGATPASETRRLFQAAVSVPPRAYFATRIKMLGRSIERSLLRHLMGRVFATLVSEGLGIEVYDSQCGLKLIPRSTYLKIVDQLVEDRFAFDPDLLAALIDAGEEVVEFPVDWKDIPGSKVSLLRDSLRMAGAVMDIRKRRRGRKGA